MSEVKTSRPFQERFLDGYDRSQLRQEVQKVKPKRLLSGFRKRAATWGLGATLALGGIGVPLKVGNMLEAAGHSGGRTGRTSATAAENTPPPEAPAPLQPANGGINADLQAAQQIAHQVSTGVTGAVSEVATAAEQAPSTVAQAPSAVAQVANATGEAAKEAFFAKEVPFGSIIYQEAKKNDLPPELVAAVAHTESKFVPTARSNRGAVGLMQLEPRTGRWLGAANLANPAENIMAGAKYLRYLTDRFGGDAQKAVAAYNAGEGNVRRFNGVPPFRETRDYVSRVMNFQRDLGSQMEGQVADLTR